VQGDLRRATTRVAPTLPRIGLQSPCRVGAGLARPVGMASVRAYDSSPGGGQAPPAGTATWSAPAHVAFSNRGTGAPSADRARDSVALLVMDELKPHAALAIGGDQTLLAHTFGASDISSGYSALRPVRYFPASISQLAQPRNRA
jgi:hypothetical protein